MLPFCSYSFITTKRFIVSMEPFLFCLSVLISKWDLHILILLIGFLLFDKSRRARKSQAGVKSRSYRMG